MPLLVHKNMMKAKILTMLRQSDGYISGQQLCETLHVSRTAVWKVIEQLKEEGYHIEAIRNKGYRLEESPDVLYESEVKSMIQTDWSGTDILFLPEIDSTNIEAKRQGEAGGKHGLLVIAEKQSAAKGRRGKQWNSKPGENAHFSILLRPDIRPKHAPMLTLVMALSVAQAIKDVVNQETCIKWPNDIVMNGKKICGILTEMSSEIDYVNHVVIGVGININQTHFEQELREKATSILLETGRNIRRSILVARVMERFEQNYECFLKSEDLSLMKQDYEAYLVNCNRKVRIVEPTGTFEGTALGINEQGELRVKKEDGTVVEIFAGEVSVRGIYGYV